MLLVVFQMFMLPFAPVIVTKPSPVFKLTLLAVSLTYPIS